MKDKDAWPFLEPVDPVVLQIPDYFTIIKRPMDFGTISKRLEKDYYTLMEWIADVRLVFQNALTYNPPGTEVAGMAERLKTLFETRLSNCSFDKSGKSSSVSPTSHKPKHIIPQTSQTVTPAHSPSPPSSSSAPILPPKVISGTPITSVSAISGASSKKRKAEPSKTHSTSNQSAPPPRNTLKPSSNGNVKRPVKTEYHPMTFEEKKRLGEKMNELTSNQLMEAIEIITETKTLLTKADDEDTLDIDMSEVDDPTLRRLEAYILRSLAENEDESGSRTNGMDEEELVVDDQDDVPLSQIPVHIETEKTKKKQRRTNLLKETEHLYKARYLLSYLNHAYIELSV